MGPIAGHKKQIELLNKSVESGKVAHGYLFSGPSFVGKRAVAFEMAQRLLCENFNACNDCPQCKTFVAQANADFIFLGSDQSIKIEEIRDLIYKLSLKPYSAKYKVAVIDNAENMTVESQNALLKGLEEPKSFTVIILVTANASKLLRTISSRAQKINFGPVVNSEYEQLLPGSLTSEEKSLITSYANGRPGLAVAIARDTELVEKLKSIDSCFQVIQGNDEIERLRLAYDLADLETVDLKQVIDFLLIKLDQELNLNPGMKIAKNLESVISARRYIDQNVNSKLLLTNLMLALT